MVFIEGRLESFTPDFKELKYKIIHPDEKTSIVKKTFMRE